MALIGRIFFGGGVHGIYQIIGAELGPIKGKIYQKLGTKKESFSYVLGATIVNFMLVDFAWIFFRADSLKVAFGYIYRMITKINPWAMFDGSIYTLGLDAMEIHILLIAICILILVDLLKYKRKVTLVEALSRQGNFFQWLVMTMLLISIVIFGIYGSQYDSTKFIYMQF